VPQPAPDEDPQNGRAQQDPEEEDAELQAGEAKEEDARLSRSPSGATSSDRDDAPELRRDAMIEHGSLPVVPAETLNALGAMRISQLLRSGSA
jgi:hypothetical protein